MANSIACSISSYILRKDSARVNENFFLRLYLLRQKKQAAKTMGIRGSKPMSR